MKFGGVKQKQGADLSNPLSTRSVSSNHQAKAVDCTGAIRITADIPLHLEFQ